MDSSVFQIPAQVVIGADMINKLPKRTMRFGQRVLVVTDETGATAAGSSSAYKTIDQRCTGDNRFRPD